jgi:hypothetical protein
LTIENESIRKTQDGYDTIEIPKYRISKIIEHPGEGIVVQTKMSNEQITIPSSIENYMEVRSALNQWNTITQQDYRYKIKLILMFIYPASTMVAFGIIMLSQNKILIMILSCLLFLVLLRGFIYSIQNRKNLSKYLQRSIWWTPFPLILILIRIYLVFFVNK